MKPSLKSIKIMMGDGRAPSKTVVSKKIQEIINKNYSTYDQGMIMGLLWVFSSKDYDDLKEDIASLYDSMK
jgi:hypothetical protein